MNKTFKASVLVGVVTGLGSQLPWLVFMIP